MSTYGKCDTIVFGKVLGQKRVFLIQNIIPSTQKYIANTYVDKQTQIPVQIAANKEREIIQKVQKVLALVRHKGMRYLVYPDILEIEKALLNN